MDDVFKDERFSHILTDPSFRRIPKKVRKIQIDNRFKTLLKNKRFTEKCSIDEHGCALKLDATENLRSLYNMDEESSDSEDMPDNEKIDKAKKHKKKEKNKMKVGKLVEKNESLDNNFRNIDNETNDQNKISKKKKVKNQKTNKNLMSESNKFSLVECKSENELSTSNAIKEFHEDSTVSKSKCPNVISNKRPQESVQAKSRELDFQFEQETSSEEECSEEEEIDKDSVKQYDSDNADSSEEDSDEDSESDDSESKESDVFDHQWEEQHERAPDTDEITRRLAVCHMDWDRIRAVDLYAVFNSFKPPDTSIVSVKIYPSEYGLQRIEEEKLNGPRELVEKTLADDEEEVEDKKGSKYHREKLRQYQMNRLKYYYAIVECDTPETANILYEQLNGMEYESSSVRFDLRFVPDDLTLDQEPTSIAENPDLTEYKPKLFVTTALQQVKVGLTWDETDPQRREILQKAFTEPDNIEKDIKEYLASSSEDSQEEISDTEEDNRKLSTKERLQKYKSLLESISEQEKEKSGEKYEMEITWEPGMKEKTESLVKEKLEEEKSYTPFEELQKKKKEKQKLKKKVKKARTHEDEESEDELSDMSNSDASTEMKISNTKKKSSKTNDELYLISDSKKVDVENDQSTKGKKKKKTKQEAKDNFKVNVNDPRFSAIYTSPLFNIDPSDPHFKKTPGNLAIIAEKQRRLKNKKGSAEEIKSNKKLKYS
ncbi:ESF1 homolog [Parasteatoda tepidariorum]|uniref:ESF1 homolog n=1 Tax=Parasteatoda tepidariorum TaxID=114398 RepID=UPI001C71B39E|nr:ESF1 homolog [Parasteatoda tepidariorum]XP_042906438.1 ESF1 homolog [Parasteatoda tepidariorum]